MEVLPAHVECAKRTFNVLARTPLLTLTFFNKRDFSLRIHTTDLIHFRDRMSIFVNVFYIIPKFVICNHVKGGGSRF